MDSNLSNIFFSRIKIYTQKNRVNPSQKVFLLQLFTLFKLSFARKHLILSLFPMYCSNMPSHRNELGTWRVIFSDKT